MIKNEVLKEWLKIIVLCELIMHHRKWASKMIQQKCIKELKHFQLIALGFYGAKQMVDSVWLIHLLFSVKWFYNFRYLRDEQLEFTSIFHKKVC